MVILCVAFYSVEGMYHLSCVRCMKCTIKEWNLTMNHVLSQRLTMNAIVIADFLKKLKPWGSVQLGDKMFDVSEKVFCHKFYQV